MGDGGWIHNIRHTKTLRFPLSSVSRNFHDWGQSSDNCIWIFCHYLYVIYVDHFQNKHDSILTWVAQGWWSTRPVAPVSHLDLRTVDMPYTQIRVHGPLTRHLKLRVAHAPGMPGTFSPPTRVSDTDMHHGTCVTHVPWCMPESLKSGFLWSRGRENVPGIPGACATCNFTFLLSGPSPRNMSRIYTPSVLKYLRDWIIPKERDCVGSTIIITDW